MQDGTGPKEWEMLIVTTLLSGQESKILNIGHLSINLNFGIWIVYERFTSNLREAVFGYAHTFTKAFF